METLLTSLPTEIILMISVFLDSTTLLNFYLTCRRIKEILDKSEWFWKVLCKTENFNFPDDICALREASISLPLKKIKELSYDGRPIRSHIDPDWPEYRKIFTRNLKIRRNIVKSKFRCWRIFMKNRLPILNINCNLDLCEIERLHSQSYLNNCKDIYVAQNDQYLVVYNYLRFYDFHVSVFDIQDEPKLLYNFTDKSKYSSIHRISIFENYIVIMPHQPFDSLIITLNIDNKLERVGEYKITPEIQNKIFTEPRNIKFEIIQEAKKAVISYRTNIWEIIIVDLPSCQFIKKIIISNNIHFTQEITTFKTKVIVSFFSHHTYYKHAKSLILIDSEILNIARIDSEYENITSYTFHPNNKSVYVQFSNYNLFLYNCATSTRTRIGNNFCPSKMFCDNSNLYMYGNVDNYCRHIFKVSSLEGQAKYSIDLNLWKFQLNHNRLHFSVHDKFLMIVDYTKILFFHVDTGKFLNKIDIFKHLRLDEDESKRFGDYELSEPKYVQFSENRIILIHNYNNCFPTIADIYKFW